jgi:hypothetical protein
MSRDRIIRRTVARLISVGAGVRLRLGDDVLGFVPPQSEVVSWQISPAPSSTASVTWVALNSDQAYTLSGAQVAGAVPLAAGEALTDQAVVPGQSCDAFPAFVLCDTVSGGLVRVVITYQDRYPGGAGDTGCH